MQFYKKHRKFIKISGMVAFATGVGWIIAKVNSTYHTLNNVLDTSVINFLEPTKYPDYNNEGGSDNYVLMNWIRSYDNIEQASKLSWNSLKFAYARRLLNMTSSDNAVLRTRAVKQLAKISSLDNWHYSLLAHMIDAKTAVGLARTENVDPRFFLRPPYRYVSYDYEMLVNGMKELLIALNSRANHSCMSYFIEKAFVDQDAERLVDHDSASTELRKLIQSADDILPLCLESLLHHSAIHNYARDIVLLSGLPLLMEIYNRFRNNMEVKITLCNILSNISIYPELLEDIYRSGWIGVLVEWVKESDIRISAPAANTLANLDDDDKYKTIYSRSIYVLHPLFRSDQNINVDVVFVHGLLGGVFFTWRQRNINEAVVGFLGKKKDKETLASEATMRFVQSTDPAMREYIDDLQVQEQLDWERLGRDFEFVLNDVPTNTNEDATGPYTCPGDHQCVKPGTQEFNSYTMCWPKDWLPYDCKNLRILGINYDTTLSMWSPICPAERMKSTLEERSTEFMAKLLKAGIGQRPIVWVTHSMGGLLVKNLLCKAWESDIPELKNMCLNTKGIVFYSTPHIGSRLANISQPTSLVLWPSVEIQELKEDSPGLLDIHQKFLNFAKDNPMKIISFVETKYTTLTALKFNFLLVDPKSANPKIGEFFEIPQDHLGICKPANRYNNMKVTNNQLLESLKHHNMMLNPCKSESHRQSFLYQKILNLIKEVSHEAHMNRIKEIPQGAIPDC